VRATTRTPHSRTAKVGAATNANKYPVGRDGELKVGDRISLDADDMVCENVEIIEIKAVRTIEYVRSARARTHSMRARSSCRTSSARAHSADKKARTPTPKTVEISEFLLSHAHFSGDLTSTWAVLDSKRRPWTSTAIILSALRAQVTSAPFKGAHGDPVMMLTIKKDDRFAKQTRPAPFPDVGAHNGADR
jgi:hypothetical protein